MTVLTPACDLSWTSLIGPYQLTPLHYDRILYLLIGSPGVKGLPIGLILYPPGSPISRYSNCRMDEAKPHSIIIQCTVHLYVWYGSTCTIVILILKVYKYGLVCNIQTYIRRDFPGSKQSEKKLS